jgi:hypothetical protein
MLESERWKGKVVYIGKQKMWRGFWQENFIEINTLEGLKT